MTERLEHVESLTETSLKKALATLDKRSDENQRLRIKHSDDPAKFAASETELFASLNEIQNVAVQPDLYEVLAGSKSLKTLLTLIAHDNTDISAKVVQMLHEFTEPADGGIEQQQTRSLVEAIIKQDLIDLLATNLLRLDVNIDEESQAINRTFDIIENVVQYGNKIDPKPSEMIIRWILDEFKKSPMTFNSMKTSAAGTLATILISDIEYKKLFGSLGGIDVLLQQVAPYRLRPPEISDEHEFLEQTFDNIIISLIDCEENREIFFNEEGIDLIVLIFFEKNKLVRKSNIKFCALKLLSFVLTSKSPENACVTKCCERFIEAFGLKVIFQFLATPRLILSDKESKANVHFLEVQDYCTTIILNLLKYCKSSGHSQRLLTKLAESNFDKFTLITMIFNVSNTRLRIWTTRPNKAKTNKETEAQAEKIKRIHFTINTCCYIILMVCYLAQQYDTHDPISGTTFMSYLKTSKIDIETLEERILELLKEMEVGTPVYNSLQMISSHYYNFVRPVLASQESKKLLKSGGSSITTDPLTLVDVRDFGHGQTR